MTLKPRSMRMFLCTLLLACAGTVIAQEFPGRKLYPEVPTMEIADLHRQIDQVIVVDVRSQYEYETLRIKGAVLIPVSEEKFAAKLGELRQAHGNKPLVFYCNGHTCEKSYQAVRKAAFAKIGALYAYDAGIFDWANSYPELTELLGSSPLDVSALLSDEKFKAHLLEPDEFTARAGASNGIILDIRDRFQREGLSIFSGRERSVPLDNGKLKGFVDQAKRENRPLFIYDATGQQVKWLQYFLEANDLPDYFFMRGGAAGFYDSLRNASGLKRP